MPITEEPFSCLGGPIESRVVNTAASRNATRLVIWTRYGLFSDIFLRAYLAAEEYSFFSKSDDTYVTVCVGIILMIMANASIVFDVRPLLTKRPEHEGANLWDV